MWMSILFGRTIGNTEYRKHIHVSTRSYQKATFVMISIAFVNTTIQEDKHRSFTRFSLARYLPHIYAKTSFRYDFEKLLQKGEKELTFLTQK